MFSPLHVNHWNEAYEWRHSESPVSLCLENSPCKQKGTEKRGKNVIFSLKKAESDVPDG